MKYTLETTLKDMMENGGTIGDLVNLLEEVMIQHNVVQRRELNDEELLLVRVTEVIHELGIPDHIKGSEYVKSAIVKVVKDRNNINEMMKLYAVLAEEFKTTWSKVERKIRNAIEIGWDRGNVEIMHDYFGYTVSSSKGKPTNSEFIALIANKIRLEGYK